MPVDLWNFALRLYRRPGVEPACLQLQAEGGDVCLLLCATWLEWRRIAPDGERCALLRDLARPWQETVVAPLRRLRQDWREAAREDVRLAALRGRLQQLELDAERELLTRLETACRDWPEAGADEGTSWLERLAGNAAHCRDALETLRAACHLPD